jgi:hypothetical protein
MEIISNGLIFFSSPYVDIRLNAQTEKQVDLQLHDIL